MWLFQKITTESKQEVSFIIQLSSYMETYTAFRLLLRYVSIILKVYLRKGTFFKRIIIIKKVI